jgi:ABC-type oligopeptide transport system ATPase subunit
VNDVTPAVPALEAENLTRIYGQRSRRRPDPSALVAVNGINLRIEPKTRLGIVGESGSGKSTLARLLAGLEAPSSGHVKWHDQRLDQLDHAGRRRYRRSVQMVFQDPFTAFNPRRRVWSSFRDVMLSWGDRHEASMRQRAEDVVQKVGLDVRHLDRFPHQLSGGQRQRMVIARCLLVKPDVLIADEAVSALDVSVQAQVLNLFRDLVDEFDLTLVFISHDLRAVGYVAEETVVMYHGDIVEAGNTERLMNAPQHAYTAALLEAAYGKQMDG